MLCHFLLILKHKNNKKYLGNSCQLPKHMLRMLEDTQTSMDTESGQNLLLCFATSWPTPSCFCLYHRVNSLELPSLHRTVSMAFHVLESCWGRLSCPLWCPSPNKLSNTSPLCIRTLHVKGKVTSRQRRQRPVNSKGMNYEIFMTVYPVQSLQHSVSHPVILWCKRHSQVSGQLITHTPEDPDIPVNQVLSLILNENFVLLISFMVRPLYRSFKMPKWKTSNWDMVKCNTHSSISFICLQWG